MNSSKDLFPREIWKMILSQIPNQNKNWINLFCVDKHLSKLCETTLCHEKSLAELNLENRSALRHFIRCKGNPSINYNYAIWVACQKGYSEEVKELLKDERTDPRAIGWSLTGLRIACENGHLEVVRELLKSRFEFSDTGKAFFDMCKSGELEIARELLTKRYISDRFVISAFRICVTNGDMKVAKMIAQVKELSVFNDCVYNNIEAIKDWSDNASQLGTNVLAIELALILAVHFNHPEVVRVLVRNVCCSQVTIDDITITAIRKRRWETAKELIKWANLDVVGYWLNPRDRDILYDLFMELVD